MSGDLEDTNYTSFNTYIDTEFHSTKLGGQCTEEDVLQRAGFWGYLMQIVYQVSLLSLHETSLGFETIIRIAALHQKIQSVAISFPALSLRLQTVLKAKRITSFVADKCRRCYSNRCCLLVRDCPIHVECSARP